MVLITFRTTTIKTTIHSLLYPFTHLHPQLLSIQLKTANMCWCETFNQVFFNTTSTGDDTIDHVVLREETDGLQMGFGKE